MDKEEIQKQAKQILDKFAEALSSIENQRKDIEIGVDRDEFEREEGKTNKEETDFKKLILKNAPQKDDDFIIVERGSWK